MSALSRKILQSLTLDWKTDETRNYLLGDVKRNDLMSEKYKNVWTNLNYFKHFPFSCFNLCFSFISWCSCSYYLFCIRIKNFCINCSIKNYKPIIKKEGKKHDKVVLLAKTELNTTEFSISEALTNSHINDDKLVSVNNFLKEYYEMAEGIRNTAEYTI